MRTGDARHDTYTTRTRQRVATRPARAHRHEPARQVLKVLLLRFYGIRPIEFWYLAANSLSARSSEQIRFTRVRREAVRW